MRYSLLIFSLFFVGLTGCKQQETILQEPILSGDLFSSVSPETGKELNFHGNTISPTPIDGRYFPIIISGNTLLYSGVFRISIPQHLELREYLGTNDFLSKTYKERILFTSTDKKKSFSIETRKNIRPETTLTAKELCKKEYVEGIISRSDTTKNIQGKNIYIVHALFSPEGLDVQAGTSQQTHFCFVDSGFIYNFSAIEYSPAYIDEIIDSFRFLK
ncbi:MAG TPA: hypothetical protein PKC87_03720 [Candidatus Absconditabacterales bacterium]|nr:hypothetical protein [Candidatus Absconditabacterales bacterium]